MRKQRLALSMTQEELGKALGISHQQIGKYEGGFDRVSAARLFDICKVLKVSISSMFEHEGLGQSEDQPNTKSPARRPS